MASPPTDHETDEAAGALASDAAALAATLTIRELSQLLKVLQAAKRDGTVLLTAPATTVNAVLPMLRTLGIAGDEYAATSTPPRSNGLSKVTVPLGCGAAPTVTGVPTLAQDEAPIDVAIARVTEARAILLEEFLGGMSLEEARSEAQTMFQRPDQLYRPSKKSGRRD